MKKYFVLICILLFSTIVKADETVFFKSDINVLKCQNTCVTPVAEGKPIQITLSQPYEGSNVIQGQYSAEKNIDDYNFNGIIKIIKIRTDKETKYFIQVLLITNIDDKSTSQLLGNVIISDLKNLNDITWKRTFEDNENTYIVSIVIGSSNL